MLSTGLPDLYIKNDSNLLKPVGVMVFQYATTSFANKINVLYQKAVDLKLQHRISRNKSFSRHLSPKTCCCNDICVVLFKQSTKGVL